MPLTVIKFRKQFILYPPKYNNGKGMIINMVMIAVVTKVNPESLLVRNVANNEEVHVNLRNPSQFSVGDRVRIIFSGQMTRSIPPQITATSIQRIGAAPPKPEPTRIRAIVLQTMRGSILAWDLQNNRLVRVDTPNAGQFRAGQLVNIGFDTITLETPPRITAITITPI